MPLALILLEEGDEIVRRQEKGHEIIPGLFAERGRVPQPEGVEVQLLGRPLLLGKRVDDGGGRHPGVAAASAGRGRLRVGV